MKNSRLWQVTVSATLEAEDAVVSLLEEVLGVPASSYYNLESGQHSVSAFLDDHRAWSDDKREALRAGLLRIQSSGLDIGPATITARRLPARNWAESWKHHFRPLRVGSRLLILPSWIKRKPQAGQKLIVLDPGLSFGTGHHPTTAYCLREIAMATLRNDARSGTSFLDLGTGSGILAIAGALLGCKPVRAIENDPEALKTARTNARQNGVHHLIRFCQQDVRELPLRPARRFSLVCANLISNLLVSESARILAQLADGGTLVVAGILEEEFEEVRKHYESTGAVLIRSRGKKEWRSGAFRPQ